MSRKLIDCILEKEINDVKFLLLKNGLRYEDKVTSTIGIYEDDQLIATGSLYENVIKMIAVDQDYKGENLTATILDKLISVLNHREVDKYFIFTTPSSKKFFMNFNFSLIHENDQLVLLENNVNTIEEQLNQLKHQLSLVRGTTAAIVMNCNPVTFGHQYLIETCSSQNDNVIIFLVEENKSVFPFETRLKLLKKVTKQFKNVHVLPSTPYIISNATFPTYFLKELNESSLLYMDLDISIFKNYFMRIFGIDLRYVGNEPIDQTTDAYNQAMKRILKDKLVIVERLQKDFVTISASIVRKLAKQKKFDELKNFVPKATYQFLKSKKGRALFHD